MTELAPHHRVERAVPPHARVLRCDACGRDEVLTDPATAKPMTCEEAHPPGPCRTIACLGCVEAAIGDRRARIELARLAR